MSCESEFHPALNALLDEAGIQHFRAHELAPIGRLAKGEGPALRRPPASYWSNILPTLRVLEELRAYVERPIHISSCYRDPAYNQAVGGSAASLHMDMNACDVHAKGVRPLVIGEWLAAHERAEIMGIGVYRTFTHVDTRALLGRRAPARWSGTGVGRWWA